MSVLRTEVQIVAELAELEGLSDDSNFDRPVSIPE